MFKKINSSSENCININFVNKPVQYNRFNMTLISHAFYSNESSSNIG